MNKGWKITLTIILTLTFIVCATIDIWYLVILKEKDNHILSYTFEVGQQTLADGSASKYFIEVEYNSNEDGSGLEEFGIKFNYMLDENQTAFYSQALQYVANEGESIVFKKYVTIGENTSKRKQVLAWVTRYFNYTNKVGVFEEDGVERYNYMSSDDYQTPVISSNPINPNTAFKIQIGNELYLMKFKGLIAQTDDYGAKQHIPFITHYRKWYDDYDVDYFAGVLFNSVKSLKNGTNRVIAFEFGDLFDYYELNPESGKYDKKVDPDKFKALTTDVKSYYSILVNKSASGVKSAGESMFNMVSGNSGFNDGSANMQNYFIGRSIVPVTLDNFTKVKIDDNNIALKLKSSFVDDLEKYSEKIKLDILIDLDKLGKLHFVGFTKDSKLSLFKVQDCQTVQTIDGQLVYKVVAYV